VRSLVARQEQNAAERQQQQLEVKKNVVGAFAKQRRQGYRSIAQSLEQMMRIVDARMMDGAHTAASAFAGGGGGDDNVSITSRLRRSIGLGASPHHVQVHRP